MMVFFLKGLILGFSTAAPVGPIGVLCIRRTLAEGRLHGFTSGLGAATADAIYGSVAAFGLAFISGALLNWQLALRLVGGLFLGYLGVRTFLAEPAEEAVLAKGQNNSLFGAYISTFFLTLTNPMTILSFAAVFAGLGIAAVAGDYGSASFLVAGVFLGSGLWWFLLSAGVSFFRSHFSGWKLVLVNQVAGIVLAGFGIVALLSIL